MKRFIFALAVALSAGVRPGKASPPPPPAPDVYAGMVNQGCGGAREEVGPGWSPAQATELSSKALGLHQPAIGRLVFSDGVRLTSDDPRIGPIQGLSLGGRWGLVAVSETRHWLVFDIHHGRLEQISVIGVAPMLGAPAAPTSLRDSAYGTMYVTFVDGQSATYPLDVCGFAAKAMIGPIEGSGNVPGHPASARPGWHVQSVSDPDAHMPDARIGRIERYALWRPDNNAAESVIELWPEQPTGPAVEVAHLPLRVSSFVTTYQDGKVWFLMSGETDKPNVVELYLFSGMP